MVIRWLRRGCENGERAARRQGQSRGSRLDGHEAFFRTESRNDEACRHE